jgi:hypothetical protein
LYKNIISSMYLRYSSSVVFILYIIPLERLISQQDRGQVKFWLLS